jgi:hypothetical protein
MIPFDSFTEVPPREDHEYGERDDLLDDLQLKRSEFAVPDSICGYLETVFEERDQPAHHNCGEKRGLAVFQMSIPRNRHEDIRAHEQQDRFHGLQSYHGSNRVCPSSRAIVSSCLVVVPIF